MLGWVQQKTSQIPLGCLKIDKTMYRGVRHEQWEELLQCFHGAGRRRLAVIWWEMKFGDSAFCFVSDLFSFLF